MAHPVDSSFIHRSSIEFKGNLKRRTIICQGLFTLFLILLFDALTIDKAAAG